VTIEIFISTYGYAALFVGAFVEEITFVVMAGFLAHEGYFSLAGVTLAASLAAFCGTEILFLFGRWKGNEWLNRHPKKTSNIERAKRFLARNQTLMILGFRYLYGLHTMGPIAMGMSRIPARRFTWLNAAGAFIWAATFSCLGYAFGRALNVLLVDLHHVERHIMAVIAIAGAAAWVIYRGVQRRKSRVEKAAA
jgi:membrane protein DedA with SNARE-associated domain